MPDASSAAVVAVAACLEDIVETDKVGFDVGVGIGDRVAHACLRREVDDNLGLEFPEQAVDERLVGDVAFHESPLAAWMRGSGFPDLCETVILDCRVVVVVEAVDAQYLDGCFTLEKLQHEVGTDESGSAGNQYFHNIKEVG